MKPWNIYVIENRVVKHGIIRKYLMFFLDAGKVNSKVNRRNIAAEKELHA